MTFRIVHTNDLHGRLGEEGAATLRAALGEEPDSVLLDSGDAVAAGNLAIRPAGEPVLRLLTSLGCRAMTIGNRETFPRAAGFRRKLADAGFPVLCANVRPRGRARLPVQPSTQFAVEGAQIAVFGVSVPMVLDGAAASVAWDHVFEPPLPVAEAQARALRPGADLLIALTHIGIAADLQLAERCPAIDLILGGHSHSDLASPRTVGGVTIVQNRGYGATYSILRLEAAGSRWKVDWQRRPLRRAGDR
jgi:2',3'-cyclic-nucleotide 2'-phosphodiesterase (5'-nucleotidase family)